MPGSLGVTEYFDESKLLPEGKVGNASGAVAIVSFFLDQDDTAPRMLSRNAPGWVIAPSTTSRIIWRPSNRG